MDVFYRLVVSILTVALFGSIITSDHPVQLDQVLKVSHDVPKRETHSCFSQPCMDSITGDRGIPFIISVALVSVLVLTGLGCLLWETCLGKGQSKPKHRRAWSRTKSRSAVTVTTTPKATSRATVNFDVDDIPDKDLYSSESDENSVLEGPEFSMMESYNVEPVAACSPYHLAWTTPSGRKLRTMSEMTKESEPCAFNVINECVDQNSKPECDQDLRRQETTLSPDAVSITSSTPFRTPRVGYAHGRPCPTPIERLASIRPGIGSPAIRIYTPGLMESSITPKKLFLEKRRQSLHTPIQRLLDIQPRTSRSDDTQGNSLLWDSYPFRPSEESLAWDDYMSDKLSISKMDENCNDPTFASLEDAMHAAPRSVAL